MVRFSLKKVMRIFFAFFFMVVVMGSQTFSLAETLNSMETTHPLSAPAAFFAPIDYAAGGLVDSDAAAAKNQRLLFSRGRMASDAMTAALSDSAGAFPRKNQFPFFDLTEFVYLKLRI